MAKPISETLRLFQGGDFNIKAGELFASVLRGVEDTGKAGKLTITLDVKQQNGAVAVLAAAVCYALSNVVGRIISRTESSATLVFWTTGAMALGGSVLSAPHWVQVLPEHGLVLLGLAVSGFLGQLAITEAFRHGQASAVAPFEYTALAWAVALAGLAQRARRLHAGRWRHHHRQRPVPDPARGAQGAGGCSALNAMLPYAAR